MAESEGSEQSGAKYEPPRAVSLSDAATGVAADQCWPGSSAGAVCTQGGGVMCLIGSGGA